MSVFGIVKDEIFHGEKLPDMQVITGKITSLIKLEQGLKNETQGLNLTPSLRSPSPYRFAMERGDKPHKFELWDSDNDCLSDTGFASHCAIQCHYPPVKGSISRQRCDH